MMEAHQLYKDGNIDQALLKYTFMAELGYEVAQSNVAYILDQGRLIMATEQLYVYSIYVYLGTFNYTLRKV